MKKEIKVVVIIRITIIIPSARRLIRTATFISSVVKDDHYYRCKAPDFFTEIIVRTSETAIQNTGKSSLGITGIRAGMLTAIYSDESQQTPNRPRGRKASIMRKAVKRAGI